MRGSRLIRGLVIAVLVSVVATACGTPALNLADSDSDGHVGVGSVGAGSTQAKLGPLRQGQYLVTEPNDAPDPGTFGVGAESDAIARVIVNSQNQVSINATGGCNIIYAQLVDGRLTGFGMTERGCAGEGRNDRDIDLVEVLQANSGVVTVINDSQFEVGGLVFTYWLALGQQAPILQYDGRLLDGRYEGWLETRTEQVVMNERIATATISQGGTRVSFDAGCNRIHAPINEDQTLGLVASTRMMCPPDSKEPILIDSLGSGDFQILSDKRFTVGQIQFTSVSNS